MEIQLNTDFLTQDEFDVVTQIKINAGVRQHMNLMKEAQRENTLEKPVVEKPVVEKPVVEKPVVEKPATKRNYTRRKRNKPRFMPKINASHLKEIYELLLNDKKPSFIARKVGLKTKTIAGVIYRMKHLPSKRMIKVLGKRKLAQLK